MARYSSLEEFRLADLEAVRLMLRGGSVIDWYRLNFEDQAQAEAFVHAQGFLWDDPDDRARMQHIQESAIGYLKRNFDFPVPKPVAEADTLNLLMLASSKGHRQLCACTILKLMHIIHHLEARELLFTLPTSDQDTFQLVEKKIYRVIGSMLTSNFPIVEFIGGRKNKDSLYTKLLSKPETVAAQIYDKLRFKLVVREKAHILPTLRYLSLKIFPFNYVIPGESKNTLINFHDYCHEHLHLRSIAKGLQLSQDIEGEIQTIDNRFTSSRYSVVHFVVDMPVRLPDELFERVEESERSLGRIIFVQAEFQITDHDTDRSNELGDASHAAYKERQKASVAKRLKLGASVPAK